MRKPCLVCGAPSAATRCPMHALKDDRKRPGYGYAWTMISREMRSRYPFCMRCGASGIGVELHVDHITPRSLGGTDHLSNLRVWCGSCHRRYGKTRRSRG
jgi:5-methylcytosine-specific restriction endonuclease McrA